MTFSEVWLKANEKCTATFGYNRYTLYLTCKAARHNRKYDDHSSDFVEWGVSIFGPTGRLEQDDVPQIELVLPKVDELLLKLAPMTPEEEVANAVEQIAAVDMP